MELKDLFALLDVSLALNLYLLGILPIFPSCNQNAYFLLLFLISISLFLVFIAAQ
jgi:hypothetical protein